MLEPVLTVNVDLKSRVDTTKCFAQNVYEMLRDYKYELINTRSTSVIIDNYNRIKHEYEINDVAIDEDVVGLINYCEGTIFLLSNKEYSKLKSEDSELLSDLKRLF
jgi:hypothetical protein